jgi:MFS family permease
VTDPGPLAPVGDGGRGTMFAALRVRNYRLYTAGQIVNVAGNWMQNVAIGWLVLQLTHNGLALGAVTAARYLPILLFGPWGGLVADRLDKRRLMCLTAIIEACLALTLGILVATHAVTVWLTVALVLAFGLVDVFDSPARQSFINNLVGRERIGNAIALNSIVVNSARILGPGAAGVLIATLGVAPCFFINAGSFAAIIASLLAMRPAELIPSSRDTRSRGQIRAALRHVRDEPALLTALIMVAVAGTFAWEFPVTLPLYTSQTFHGTSATYGTALSCLAAGSIGGGLLAARRQTQNTRSLAVSAIIWGTLIIAAAVSPSLPIAFILLAFVGAGAVTFNSATKTLLQLQADEKMRGRVMALWFIGWQGSTVIGAPIVGGIAQSFGARYGLGIGGLTTLLTGVIVLIVRRRWRGSSEIVDAGTPNPDVGVPVPSDD